jgi:hypothetical protein
LEECFHCAIAFHPLTKRLFFFSSPSCLSNHGRKLGETASRGTFLNFKVLKDIFRWAEVGYYDKVLKACYNLPSPSPPRSFRRAVPPPPPVFPHVFLGFHPNFNQAIIRVHPELLDTVFDIIPAHAVPSDLADHQLRYVFMLKPTRWQNNHGRFVKWDTKGISLVKELAMECLVSIMRPNDDVPARLVVLPPRRPQQMPRPQRVVQLDTSGMRFEDYFAGSRKVVGNLKIGTGVSLVPDVSNPAFQEDVVGGGQLCHGVRRACR